MTRLRGTLDELALRPRLVLSRAENTVRTVAAQRSSGAGPIQALGLAHQTSHERLEMMRESRAVYISPARRRRISHLDQEVGAIDTQLADLSGGHASFPPGADAPDSPKKGDLLARRRMAMDELIELHSPRLSGPERALLAAIVAVIAIVALLLIA